MLGGWSSPRWTWCAAAAPPSSGGDVDAALGPLRQAAAREESGDVLDALAEATHCGGDREAGSALLARACAAYEREGRPVEAARSARTLAYQYVLNGDRELASGWAGRARRLVGDRPETAEGQWVELFETLADPDAASRETRLRRLVDEGRRLGDRNLECDALGLLGGLCVDDGRLAEGLGLLDEALAAVHAGEVDEVVVVEGAFCMMLAACEATQDVERAEHWTAAGERWGRLRGLAFLAPLCRGYHGGVLMAAGRYAEAGDLLTDTIARLERGYVLARDNALVRLAELRLRQGEPEAAAVLLRGLEEHPDAAYPLAALHLAQGRPGMARERAERALARVHGVTEGRLLGLLASTALAEGDLAAAEDAAARLTALAGDRSSAYLGALAGLTRGRVCLAGGDRGAADCLREALSGFAGARMPLELAEARLEYARAVAATAPEAAVSEARLALEAGELLAAGVVRDRAAALLRELGAPGHAAPRGAAALTRREAEVLELLGHGLANPEIAARLVISRKTVEHHVSRVLHKLGLRNRAEAAAYATRRRAT